MEMLDAPQTNSNAAAALTRIAEIDAMFASATHWGSWMVEAANEREHLATRFGLEHKNLARSADGGRVD
jgi:hypothetical protein